MMKMLFLYNVRVFQLNIVIFLNKLLHSPEKPCTIRVVKIKNRKRIGEDFADETFTCTRSTSV